MKLIRTECVIENNRPILHLFCREDGKRVVYKEENFSPYFYILEEDRNKILGLAIDEQKFKSVYGEDVIKVYVPLPGDVSTLKNHYKQHYEADVPYPIRYMLDLKEDIEPSTPSVMYIDIETVSKGRIPDTSTAPEVIICITAYSQGTYSTFIHRSDLAVGAQTKQVWDTLQEIHYYRDERDMLQGFLDYYEEEEPDVITGWNFILFDMPYIINRLKRLGIDYTRLSPLGRVHIDDFHRGSIIVSGVAVIDLLDVYKKITMPTQGTKSSYSLDAIGDKVVGEGKTGSHGGNTNWLWNYSIDEMIEYNTQDVRLCYEIDKKEQLIQFLNEIRMLSYCQLEHSMVTGKIIDGYILRLFHNKLVFPSKKKREVDKFQGAIVESRAGGLYENVAVYDIKSLYPSIIVSANLSPETMRDEIEDNTIPVGKYHVRQDIDGYLPEVVKLLFKEREKYKELRKKEEYDSDEYKLYDIRQGAIKILLNSLYGQTAFPNSRIYDVRVAETVTWMGRDIIIYSRDFLDNIGYPVLYLDTDSLHTQFDEYDIDHMKILLDVINDSYEDYAKKLNLKSHIFQMEFEKVYRRVFYGKNTKKRYAGAIRWKDGKDIDKLDIWGFETKRSDASKLTKRLLTNVFDMVLRQNKDRDVILKYIGSEIETVRSGRAKLDDIGIPKGMSKMPLEYIKGVYDKELPSYRQKGLNANIRGVLYSIDELGINELSMRPKLIYVKDTPAHLPNIDVICFDNEEQIPPGTVINLELMLEKTVKAKLQPLFEGLGWKLSSLLPWWRGKAPKNGVQERLL